MDRYITYKYPRTLPEKPFAVAFMEGSDLAPGLNGTVSFYDVNNGTLVEAEIFNLPPDKPPSQGEQPIGPFGFHLHDGFTCGMPDMADPFSAAMGHYNPGSQQHPYHAGDFPVLFGNNGYAFMIFYTNRFRPSDVIGRAVVIHQNPDDFRSQPAGNSGKRIACGIIRKV